MRLSVCESRETFRAGVQIPAASACCLVHFTGTRSAARCLILPLRGKTCVHQTLALCYLSQWVARWSSRLVLYFELLALCF